MLEKYLRKVDLGDRNPKVFSSFQFKVFLLVAVFKWGLFYTEELLISENKWKFYVGKNISMKSCKDK